MALRRFEQRPVQFIIGYIVATLLLGGALLLLHRFDNLLIILIPPIILSSLIYPRRVYLLLVAIGCPVVLFVAPTISQDAIASLLTTLQLIGVAFLICEIIFRVCRRQRAVEEELVCSQEALRTSEEHFRLIFELAPIGIAITSFEGQIQRVNAALCHTLGYSPDELCGKLLTDISHPDDMATNLQLRRTLIDRHIERFEMEKRYIRRNGEIVHAKLYVTAVRDRHDAPTQLIGQVADLTEYYRLEQERLSFERTLQETQKLESLGLLAGGIAHDFNNLLTSILGNASLARMTLPSDAPTVENLTQIEIAVRSAADLTRQMLAYAGKGQFIIRPVLLNAIVTEIARLLRVSLPRPVQIVYELGEGLPTIAADATQMRQVVMNLVLNAAEAIGDAQGTVFIATAMVVLPADRLPAVHPTTALAPGEYLCLTVRDTGHGMTSETRAKIFDPFFTTKFAGRGLGLAAVLGIVRHHRGALRVESEPGIGSCFSVFFPVTRPT